MRQRRAFQREKSAERLISLLAAFHGKMNSVIFDNTKLFEERRNFMSLKVINNPEAYATDSEKFTWELEWHPNKSYSRSVTVSICCANLRSFISWKWVRIDVEEGKVDYRTAPESNINDIKIRNSQMKLISVRFPSVRIDRKIRFWITAQPYPQTGNSPVLKLYVGETIEKAEEEGSVRLTFRPGIVARFSIYARPCPRKSGIDLGLLQAQIITREDQDVVMCLRKRILECIIGLKVLLVYG